jgi:hypothetical protein
MTFPAKSRIFEPTPESKSLLVLFFRKEQESLLFLKKKKQKDFYFRRVVFSDTGLGRKVIANPHLQGLARGEQLRRFSFSEQRRLMELCDPLSGGVGICTSLPAKRLSPVMKQASRWRGERGGAVTIRPVPAGPAPTQCNVPLYGRR